MRSRFAFLYAIIAAIAFTGRALPLHAQLGLALVPMRAEIQINAGGQHTETVRLSNDSDSPTRVRAEALDFFIDDSLTPQFGSEYAKEKQFSCRDWIQINPREFELEPKETMRVRYTLQVPPDTAEGEYHCGAGFATLPPIAEGEVAMGVRTAVRAVTSIYVVIGKPASVPSLKDLSVRSLPDGTWQVAALFKNEGRRLFRVSGFLEVQDASGKVIEKLEYPTFPVLPQREQLFPLTLKESLLPGKYVVHTQADVGLPSILDASTSVVVDEKPRSGK